MWFCYQQNLLLALQLSYELILFLVACERFTKEPFVTVDYLNIQKIRIELYALESIDFTNNLFTYDSKKLQSDTL